MKHFSIKNWDDLQHYKDRAPPWIKLYNHLLDDYEFSCLQDASKLHLVLIWLLASRNSNKLPYNEKWIQQRIGVDSPVNLSNLVKSGFIVVEPSNDGALQSMEQDASTMLSDCKQVATTEERREEERESKADAEKSKGGASATTDFSVFTMMTKEQILEMRRIRKKNKGGTITDRVAKALANEFSLALQNGHTVDQCLTEWEVRSWKSFKADWMKSGNGYTSVKAAKQKEADDWANSSGTGMFDYGDIIDGEVINRE